MQISPRGLKSPAKCPLLFDIASDSEDHLPPQPSLQLEIHQPPVQLETFSNESPQSCPLVMAVDSDHAELAPTQHAQQAWQHDRWQQPPEASAVQRPVSNDSSPRRQSVMHANSESDNVMPGRHEQQQGSSVPQSKNSVAHDHLSSKSFGDTSITDALAGGSCPLVFDPEQGEPQQQLMSAEHLGEEEEMAQQQLEWTEVHTLHSSCPLIFDMEEEEAEQYPASSQAHEESVDRQLVSTVLSLRDQEPPSSIPNAPHTMQHVHHMGVTTQRHAQLQSIQAASADQRIPFDTAHNGCPLIFDIQSDDEEDRTVDKYLCVPAQFTHQTCPLIFDVESDEEEDQTGVNIDDALTCAAHKAFEQQHMDAESDLRSQHSQEVCPRQHSPSSPVTLPCYAHGNGMLPKRYDGLLPKRAHGTVSHGLQTEESGTDMRQGDHMTDDYDSNAYSPRWNDNQEPTPGHNQPYDQGMTHGQSHEKEATYQCNQAHDQGLSHKPSHDKLPSSGMPCDQGSDDGYCPMVVDSDYSQGGNAEKCRGEAEDGEPVWKAGMAAAAKAGMMLGESQTQTG